MNLQRDHWVAYSRNALFLIIASQGILWLALALAESKGRPDALPTPEAITLLFADKNGEVLENAAPIEVPLVAEPGYIYSDPDRHQRALFIHTFDLGTGNSSEEFGVLLGWDRRISEVRLNDWPLKTQAPLDVWGILGGHDPVVYSLPNADMQQGENTLTFLNSGRSKKIMPYFFIGELSELYVANNWLRMFSVDLVVVSIGVLIFAVLLNLLIVWPDRDKTRIRSLNLLLFAWTLRNLTFLGIDSGLPDPLRLLSHFAITYLFLFSVLIFSLGWTRARRRWFVTTFIALALCVLVAGVATLHSQQLLFDISFALETALTIGIGLLSVVIFTRHWIGNGYRETVEILLFLVCIGAIVTDAIDDRWRISIPLFDIPLTFYAAPMCGILLALGMVASIATQSTRARVATDNVNELLRSKLQEQEEQLTESYEREKHVEKQRILVGERQRIIRDMHDGVGGSLMSLLLRARRDELSKENLVRALSASMHELRLIIDSFDHVGDNLEFALSVFQQRLEPELKEQGIALHYRTSAAEAISGFGPESVLQIYRFLQETCNNAINHGRAGNLFIELSTDLKQQQINISVRDDGTGFDPDVVTHGRGLRNLAHRAESLSGTLGFADNGDNPGSQVSLTLPMR